MSLSAGSTILRASSGSRSSINSIEPLMSAKSAVTVLRSPSRAAGLSVSGILIGFDGSGLAEPEPSGVVHWPQNLNPRGFSNPHLGHTCASEVVHCPQNFIPPGLSKPHLEQRIFLRSRDSFRSLKPCLGGHRL